MEKKRSGKCKRGGGDGLGECFEGMGFGDKKLKIWPLRQVLSFISHVRAHFKVRVMRGFP